jgi:hypothetical protein
LETGLFSGGKCTSGNKYLVLYDKSNPARSIIYLEYPPSGEIGDTICECKKDKIFIKVMKSTRNIVDMYLK